MAILEKKMKEKAEWGLEESLMSKKKDKEFKEKEQEMIE
jgi:hypothetical protein